MEYYLYISDSKVDMLLPQVPEKTRAKLAAEFGVNVGVLEAKFKSERDTGTPDNRVARLQAVINHIRPSLEVGSVEQPGKWIEDVQDARSIYLADNKQIIFFIGKSRAGARFGLGGSAAHLVSRGKGEKVEIGWSFLPDLLFNLQVMLRTQDDPRLSIAATEEFIKGSTKENEFEWMDLLDHANRMASGPSMKIKFLAKTLLAGTHPNDHVKGILATPLYVAMAD